MAVHPCLMCKRLIPVGITYCDSCRPEAEARAAAAVERKRKHYNRTYNKRRDPKYLTFYRSKEWRLLSRTYLQAAGYACEAGLAGCSKVAVEVHHTKPIQTEEGWALRLEWDNLEAVCTNCHNGRHQRGRRKPMPGVIDIRLLER